MSITDTRQRRVYPWLYVTLRVWDAPVPSGVEPTETFEIGDPIGRKARRRHEHSGWTIRSGAPRDVRLEKHVDDILERATPLLRSPLPKGALAQLTVLAYGIRGNWLSFELRPDQLRQLATIPAGIDFDLDEDWTLSDIREMVRATEKAAGDIREP